MKKKLIVITLLLVNLSLNAQYKDMEKSKTALRLIYPQWQGGVIMDMLPELPSDDASRGYYLGAQLLKLLARDNGQKTVEVPISLDVNDRANDKGINSRKAIIKQTQAALDIIKDNNPERIVTLGGECSVSVVPFNYLAAKYSDNIAMVWIDSHPDINLPGDKYTGYHAMALTASLGMGDEEIVRMLPTKIDPSKALIVGLRAWEPGIKERQLQLGIKGLATSEVANNSTAVLDWLKSTGVSKVFIHFDLDVLDPKEIIAAVGTEPDGMKIAEVIRVINDISAYYDIVGLTVAEHMPRVEIKIKNILDQLPLLKK